MCQVPTLSMVQRLMCNQVIPPLASGPLSTLPWLLRVVSSGPLVSNFLFRFVLY